MVSFLLGLGAGLVIWAFWGTIKKFGKKANENLSKEIDDM